jgi:hypothetical protein
LTDYESFQKSAFNSKKWHCDFGRNKVWNMYLKNFSADVISAANCR